MCKTYTNLFVLFYRNGYVDNEVLNQAGYSMEKLHSTSEDQLEIYMDDWNIECVVAKDSDDLSGHECEQQKLGNNDSQPVQDKFDDIIVVKFEERLNDNLIEEGTNDVSEGVKKVASDKEDLGVEQAENNVKNKKGVYMCDKCSHVFSSLFWFSKHTEKCGLLYQCDICPKILKNEKCLKEHILKRHGNSFECETCDKSFNTVKKLQNHVKSVHQAKKECQQCKIICKNSRTLREHLKKNCRGITEDPNNEDAFDRRETENNANENTDANNNSGQHDDHLEQKVNVDKVVEHSDVQNMESKETKNTAPKLQCKNCPKTFGTTNGLRRHILTHKKLLEASPSSDLTNEPISITIDDNGNALVQIAQLHVGGNYDDVEIEYIES